MNEHRRCQGPREAGLRAAVPGTAALLVEHRKEAHWSPHCDNGGWNVRHSPEPGAPKIPGRLPPAAARLPAGLPAPLPLPPLRWLMRQAGRYLPEYCATCAPRPAASAGLATNVDYATEVTLQLLDRFALDAAIPVLGHPHRARRHGPGPVFRRGEGPKFEVSLKEEWAIRDRRRRALSSGLANYVMDAVAEIRRALDPCR